MYKRRKMAVTGSILCVIGAMFLVKVAISTWSFVKGNLCSVDRSYGWLTDNLSHNIGTHQIHHLFIGIPHYKLNEATAHFRAAFPHLVRSSDQNPYVAYVQS